MIAVGDQNVFELEGTVGTRYGKPMVSMIMPRGFEQPVNLYYNKEDVSNNAVL